MPTGYTAIIGDKNITFRDFAMRCARAFGACIELRYESMDAPIPEQFSASSYHADGIEKAKSRLAEVEAMSLAKCQEQAKSDFETQKQYHLDGIEKDKALKEKYEAMLAQVKMWNPPSDEHEGLKKFMAEQITQSLEHDCGREYHRNQIKELALLSGEKWRKQESDKAKKDIKYHTKEQAAEVKRASERTKWIKQLRESL